MRIHLVLKKIQEPFTFDNYEQI